MSIPITQRAKQQLHNNQVVRTQVAANSEYPVIEKDNLEPGVVAEANQDGTIFVDADVSDKKKAEAVEHEKVHMNQMERGDLSYDDKNVYWKGKTFAREEMEEGAKNLPWEQEAWKANARFKQQNA
tara:strand:- start:423 stop:800 length:378 start_codon:yes stop_codon:yes gene_type:complete